MRKRWHYSRGRGFKKTPKVFEGRKSAWGFSRWRGRLTKIILLTACFLLLGFGLSRLGLFLITKVDVTTASNQTIENLPQIKASLEKELIKKNLILVSLQPVTQKTLNENPSLLQVNASRKYPNTVSVSLVSRQPVLKLKAENQSETLLVDANGVVFAQAGKEDLPLLTADSSVQLGDHLGDSNVAALLEVISGLSAEKLSFVAIKSDNTLEIELGTLRVLFSSRKPIQDQLLIFQDLRNRYQMRNLKLKQIDLRFDRPVVQEN